MSRPHLQHHGATCVLLVPHRVEGWAAWVKGEGWLSDSQSIVLELVAVQSRNASFPKRVGLVPESLVITLVNRVTRSFYPRRPSYSESHKPEHRNAFGERLEVLRLQRRDQGFRPRMHSDVKANGSGVRKEHMSTERYSYSQWSSGIQLELVLSR